MTLLLGSVKGYTLAQKMVAKACGRGLHSSTFQLNLSRF